MASARDTDTVARLGGDEFVVILEGLSEDREQAAFHAGQVGEAIRQALTEPFQFKDVAHHSSASLGIALFSGTEQSVETLLKQADLAMYRAKDGGKNTVRFFDPEMQTALDERAALEADLRAALDLDQLQLYFQPQVDQHGTICGAEALLRWIHPDRGFVPPDRFIPIAEATGQILSIGHWVLDSACQQLERWSKQFPEMDLTMAVNVSPEEFRQVDFVDQVRSVVQHRQTDPSRLRLELTETMMVEEVEVTINKMEALQNLGIGFSLDDFGTGYSSLSYLTRLPLNTLKIDKTFVLNLPDNHNDAVIAQTVISMAQSLELDVIAEGVETLEQRDFLVNHDCMSFQGYLFSPPVPQADFERLLETGEALMPKAPHLD
jgi:predicted signal transduction protein with EAL and GGDEF domain